MGRMNIFHVDVSRISPGKCWFKRHKLSDNIKRFVEVKLYSVLMLAFDQFGVVFNLIGIGQQLCGEVEVNFRLCCAFLLHRNHASAKTIVKNQKPFEIKVALTSCSRPMHVRRLSWCKCASIFSQNRDLRCLSRWMRRCTRRQPSARHSPLIAMRAESTRKPNPIVRRTDSTSQCCNKARTRLSPSIKRVDNTPATFLAGNCRNNGRRCSSALLCSSNPIGRCFCTLLRTRANCL